MGNTRAILVGVSTYAGFGINQLPMCKNDLYEVRDTLKTGLNVDPRDIFICGESGLVLMGDLIQKFEEMETKLTEDDTFIFYFTGHGGNSCLRLSYERINLQGLIDLIENKISTKSKIIIIDSCHSGDFEISNKAKFDIEKTIEEFAGHGYAVLASCGPDQESGFNESRKISLYTSFVCDALRNPALIREGKKSLEMIGKAIEQYSSAWESNHPDGIQQHPIFRSNIGGTIFFPVAEYHPYQITNIYEETEKYIIYAVKPVHHADVKRLAVKVILKNNFLMEEIADLTLDIKDKLLYAEVYQSANEERRFKGKPTNIVCCYFGFDQEDMVHPHYLWLSTWVDDSQDKDSWYGSKKDSKIIRGVYVEEDPNYEILRSIMNYTGEVEKSELMQRMHEILTEMITLGEEMIYNFREYKNEVISEEKLVLLNEELGIKITDLYMQQNDLPAVPIELYEWATFQIDIGATIQDFALFFDRKNLTLWNADNRKFLMEQSINRYQKDLERLKEKEKMLQIDEDDT